LRKDAVVTHSVARVNSVLQCELRRRGLDEVSAVEAALWLEATGVLADSASRPGLPLRRMLRAGSIDGAEQRPAASHGRWYIKAADAPPVGRGRRQGRSPAASRAKRTPQGDREFDAARRRRDRAARKYLPADIKLLLVAEAPPAALDRYFYFEDVTTQDSLFRYVARVILRVEPTRSTKGELLAQLRARGVFLIDLKRDPVDAQPLADEIPQLLRRIRRLKPEKIIVIKASVFDLVRDPLISAGLSLIDERVPFPGSGQQRRFVAAFLRALKRAPAGPRGPTAGSIDAH
jgi:hypothetical protein